MRLNDLLATSDDPYAPPAATVEDVPPPVVRAADLPFFPVSVTKLVVMYVCTLGLYELHWFYENWKRVNLRGSRKVVPLARTIFATLFCYPCFRMVRVFPRPSGTATPLAAGPLAIGWILTSHLWWLSNSFLVTALFAVVFLIPVQRQINRINAEVAPAHEANAQFTVLNWVGIVIGGLVLALVLLVTFVAPA